MPAHMRWILPMSAVVVIAIGAVIAAVGDKTLGLIVVAAGAIDLATMPLILRAVTRRGRGSSPASSAEPAPVDPTQDPSYNPYARED